MTDWRHVVQVSRPLAWVYTALPFLVAAVLVERGLTPAIVIGTVYFLGPYNLLLYGSEDIHEYSAEAGSPAEAPEAVASTPVAAEPSKPAKGARGARAAAAAAAAATADAATAAAAATAAEPAAEPPAETADVHATRMRIAIALTNLPFLVVLVLVSGAAAGVALALAVVVAVVDATPPFRTKDRPILDCLTGAMQVVLPAVCGFLVAGLSVAGLPWIGLAALTAWAVASFALRALRDRPVDGTGEAADAASIATMLGTRGTALVALGGYLVTAALAATYGRLGILAALGLDLYLLLPVMILVAKRGDPAAEAAAIRRAWAGFGGLGWLIGAWLVLLVLRHWRVTPFSALEILTAVTAIAVGYAMWNVLAIRVATRRRRARRGADEDVAALTIVVPCRDEARRLSACLDALLDQTYADATILVVDDSSTDDTVTLAAELIGGAGQVVVAPPKPDEWTGKNWACQVGAEAATTDLVMFVDADTILVPVATRIIVEQFETQRLDLLSGLTQYAMPTRGERAAVPGFALLLFGFVPIWLSALTRGRIRPLAFAYGPLMLVRREAYLETGGHAATPGSLRGGIDLARTFARAGRRVGTVHASDLAATRHFPTADAAVGAWRRVTLPYAGGSLAMAIATIVLEVLTYVVPFLLPPIALLSGAGVREIVASFVPLLLLGAMRLALALTQREPLTTIVWHPVTVAVTLAGQLAGIADHVIGRAPHWHGRVLEPSASAAEPPA